MFKRSARLRKYEGDPRVTASDVSAGRPRERLLCSVGRAGKTSKPGPAARPGFLPPGAAGCSVIPSTPNSGLPVFLLHSTVCLASCESYGQKTMNSLAGFTFPPAGNVIIDWSQLPAGLSLIFRPLSYTEIKLTIQLGEFHGGYLLIAPWLTCNSC